VCARACLHVGGGGLSYPGCKAHAPYYILICGLSSSTIFFHVLINGMIIGREHFGNEICVLIFSTTSVGNTFYFKNNSAR
jgi:hypothetical protein